MTNVNQTCRDLAELKDNAQLACRALFYECAMRGIKVFVTETYRSQARQNHLFYNVRPRVTWVLSSRHTSRLAWDIAVCAPANLYDTKTLEAVGVIAKELGITWGGVWRPGIDRPHFEVPASWTLPKKYNEKIIRGVIVPSTSTGKVTMAVADNEALYAKKIGHNIVEGATKFRLMSGPFEYWQAAENKRLFLLGKDYLKYAETHGNDKLKFRVQSGAYTTSESAEIVARLLIREGLLEYVSINGSLK